MARSKRSQAEAAPGTATEPATPDPGDWGIIGHERARGFLQAAIAQGRPGHAYLVTGPAGTGKTTLVRAFARSLNCEAPIAPCWRCGPCRRLSRGTFVDYLALAPEAERRAVSVDQVRSLTEHANLAPLDGRYKIFVIENAELLSPAAANALLKLVEEPPPRVVLILTAQRADTVIPTLRSRSIALELRPVPGPTLVAALLARGMAAERAADLAALAGGLPAVALASEAAGGEAAAAETLLRVLEGDLAARLGEAETLAAELPKDRDRARRLFRVWGSALEGALLMRSGAIDEAAGMPPRLKAFCEPLMLSQIAALLRAVERCQQRIDVMQPRLALDVFMLDVGDLLGPDTPQG